MGVKKIYNKGLFLLSFVLIFIVFLSFNTKALTIQENKYFIDNSNGEDYFNLTIHEQQGISHFLFKYKVINPNEDIDFESQQRDIDNLNIYFELEKSLFYENNGQQEIPLNNGYYSYVYDINFRQFILYYNVKINNFVFKDIIGRDIGFRYQTSSNTYYSQKEIIKEQLLKEKKETLKDLYQKINYYKNLKKTIEDIYLYLVPYDFEDEIFDEKEEEVSQFVDDFEEFREHEDEINIFEYDFLKHKNALDKIRQFYKIFIKESHLYFKSTSTIKREKNEQIKEVFEFFYNSLQRNNKVELLIENFEYYKNQAGQEQPLPKDIVKAAINNLREEDSLIRVLPEGPEVLQNENRQLKETQNNLIRQKQTLEEEKRQLEREKQSLQNEKESLTASNSQKESQINLLNNNILTLNNRIQEKDNEIVLLNAKIAESENNERTNTQGEETQKENNVKQKADKIGEEILKYLPYVLIAFFALILIIIILKLTLGLLFRRKRR